MNTAALKRFAQQARNILKEGVEKRFLYWGFDKKGNLIIDEPKAIDGGMILGEMLINDASAYKKWCALREAILEKGIDQVAEEAAYTWFNRLMAIRILARNGYINPQLEFESETIQTPVIVTNAKRGIISYLNSNDNKLLERLIEDDQKETELFTLLITAYCHNSDLLYCTFGRLDDYTELLLPTDILATNGFIHLLNTSDAITTEDYQKVELIGWLYQFYISEKKDEVFKGFKNKKKAEAEDIPAATQIFTPNWIVKYMVQNTAGRIWLDLNPQSKLRKEMDYLVESQEEEQKSEPIISEVAELKLLDPACGSGHILVEGFDLLFAMYREEGYPKGEAVRSILKNNLVGIDLDERAVQLSKFALLLKAATQDRTVIDGGIIPRIYEMPDRKHYTEQQVKDFLKCEDKVAVKELYEALELMSKAYNLGSIMQFNLSDKSLQLIRQRYKEWCSGTYRSMTDSMLWSEFAYLIEYLLALTQKYEAVAANPPYMGSGNMNEELKGYLSKTYPDSKSDLFAVFIEAMINFCCKDGKLGCITMESWMFLSSYEKLRTKIIDNYYIASLAHFGWHIIGIAFGTAAMILEKRKAESKIGEFSYLTIDDINREKNIPYIFPKKDNGRYANISQSNFEKIPGSPIAYWVSKKIYLSFEQTKTSKFAHSFQGLITGDNNLLLRLWHEVQIKKCKFDLHSYDEAYNKLYWVPYLKGGSIRKWFGNKDFLLRWNGKGDNLTRSRSENKEYYFKEGITWSFIGSGIFNARLCETGSLWDVAGSSLFPFKQRHNLSLLSFLNSNVAALFLKIINPTINFQVENLLALPIYKNLIDNEDLHTKTINNISISKQDWDSHETSWDFQENELIKQHSNNIQTAFEYYSTYWTEQFRQLHQNEVELNRIFIEIYGLQDELTPEVKLKDITILQSELDSNVLGDTIEIEELPEGKLPIKESEIISQLLSYAMGCIMGRYRLDKPGLHIAHSNPSDKEIAPYEMNGKTFYIDDDAIVPLMDSQCSFGDNALNRIKTFLEIVWGEDMLIDNINFINAALGKDLETYLIKDFWKEHCNRYQKRPIYWLFSSPKGAFRVITYMHRMNRFTVEKIRSNYLLKYIQNLENRIARLEADSASLNRTELRDLEKLKTDLTECREYDLLLKDCADQQIDFDLDDGVVVNYKKFGKVVMPVK